MNVIQLVRIVVYLLYSALLKSSRGGKRTGSYDPGPNACPPRVRRGNLLVLLARPPAPFYILHVYNTVLSYVMKFTIKPFTFENDSVFFPVVVSESVYVPGPGLSSASSLVSDDPNLRLVLLKPWCSFEATKKVWYLLGMDAMCDGESDCAVAVIY